MHDAGSFYLVSVLIDERAGIVELTRRIGDLLQQRQCFRLL
jgi:hypothetical protein